MSCLQAIPGSRTPIPHQIMVPAAGTAALAPQQIHQNASMRTVNGSLEGESHFRQRGVPYLPCSHFALFDFGVPNGLGAMSRAAKGKKERCEIGDVMQRDGRSDPIRTAADDGRAPDP